MEGGGAENEGIDRRYVIKLQFDYIPVSKGCGTCVSIT